MCVSSLRHHWFRWWPVVYSTRSYYLNQYREHSSIKWISTRTTRPPALRYPTPWLHILLIHIRSQIKTSQSQSYTFINTAKKFQILQETLHATHLLKLLDKMYKYEMGPTRTVGATERTRDAGRTDERTDGVKAIYTPPPPTPQQT